MGWLDLFRQKSKLPQGIEGTTTKTTIEAAAVKARLEAIVGEIRRNLDHLEEEVNTIDGKEASEDGVGRSGEKDDNA